MTRDADSLQSGRLVVVSGPSGVGKSTITRAVLEQTGVIFSVSATTRKPRSGEVDGKDYHFIDRPAFEQMIERGEMLEWAEVFGNLYGSPLAPVQEAIETGKVVLLEIDIQGGLQVHEKMPEATFVLITPPSEQELERRLRGRGTEDEKSFCRRFGKAKEELKTAIESGIYTKVVVNEDLENTIPQVVKIVTG
jgi:guanylate kinase